MEVVYLDTDLKEVDLHGQELPAVDVRVVGLLKGLLQLMELEGGEGGAVTPVLLLRAVLLWRLGGLFPAAHPLLEISQVPVTLVPGEKARL